MRIMDLLNKNITPRVYRIMAAVNRNMPISILEFYLIVLLLSSMPRYYMGDTFLLLLIL